MDTSRKDKYPESNQTGSSVSGIRIPDFIRNSKLTNSSFPRIINESSTPTYSQPMNITLRERLGKGGFGTVYRCTNEENEVYAVKVIPTKDKGIPCLMEASIMATYRYSGLNTAKMIMANSTHLYILQELAVSDLSKWRAKELVTDRQIMEISHTLIRACNFLHLEGIIHGDLKASNILIYSDGSVKISDFTLATCKIWCSSTNTRGRNLCTVTHRPLEVWRRQEISEKVDIWSLGCTLFELAFGYSLFPYQGPEDTRDRSINALLDWYESRLGGNSEPGIQRKLVCQKIPELPTNWDPDDKFVRLILRMLKIFPADRPSADELLKDDYFSDFSPLYEDNLVHKIINRAIRTSIGTLVNQRFKQWTNQEMVRNLAKEIFIRISPDIVPSECRTSYNRKSYKGTSSEIIRSATCIWMAHKLVNNSTIRIDIFQVPLHVIIQTERAISNELGFMIHRLGNNHIRLSLPIIKGIIIKEIIIKEIRPPNPERMPNLERASNLEIRNISKTSDNGVSDRIPLPIIDELNET